MKLILQFTAVLYNQQALTTIGTCNSQYN